MTTGRPRLYPDNATRQQAYRARQAKALTTLRGKAKRLDRKKDARQHARFMLGVTAAQLLRDAPPRLLQVALDDIERGGYDKEWLERDALGPRFRRLIDYIVDVQAGRPLYTLFQGDPLEVSEVLDPASVDVLLTDPPWGGDAPLSARAVFQVAQRLLKPGGSLTPARRRALSCPNPQVDIDLLIRSRPSAVAGVLARVGAGPIPPPEGWRSRGWHTLAIGAHWCPYSRGTGCHSSVTLSKTSMQLSNCRH